MKNFKRIIATTIAASMVMSLASCSALTDKTADEIEEIATSYMENLVAGKYDKAAKLVDGGENDFAAAELDDDHMAILDAMFAATEFEIDDVEGKKEDSGKAKIIIQVPDLAAAIEDADSSSVDDIVAAIEDADKSEEEVTLKFTYDDEWLIKDDDAVTSVFISSVENAEFGGLSEAAALEYVNARFDAIMSGDLEAMYDFADHDEYPTFADFEADANNQQLLDFMLNVFSTLDYSSYVFDSTDEYVDVYVEGTIVDVQQVMENGITDDVMAAVMAYSLFSDSPDGAMGYMVESLNGAVGSVSDRADVTFTYRVTADENGELSAEKVDGNNPFEDMEFDSSMFEGREMELMALALTYALDNGLCSADEYEQYQAYISGGEVVDVPEGAIDVQQGSDFYRIYFYSDRDRTQEVEGYTTESNGFHIVFRTMGYYDMTDTYSCSLVNEEGTELFSGSANMNENSCDTGYIDIDADSGIPAGIYVMTIIGCNGEVFATVTFNVA